MNILEKMDTILDGKELYLAYDEEDMVCKRSREGDFATIKIKGRDEYPINKKTDLADKIFLYGEIITREKYEAF